MRAQRSPAEVEACQSVPFRVNVLRSTRGWGERWPRRVLSDPRIFCEVPNLPFGKESSKTLHKLGKGCHPRTISACVPTLLAIPGAPADAFAPCLGGEVADDRASGARDQEGSECPNRPSTRPLQLAKFGNATPINLRRSGVHHASEFA